MQMHRGYGINLAAPDFVNLPIGPDETMPCLQYGIVLIKDGDARLAVLFRGSTDFGPQ